MTAFMAKSEFSPGANKKQFLVKKLCFKP